MKEETTERVREKKVMNVNSIREILWEEIDDLRNGNTTAANLSAITNASGKILSTVALQLKYAQLTGKKVDDIPMLSFEEQA